MKEQALAEIRRIVEAHGLDAGDLHALADGLEAPASATASPAVASAVAVSAVERFRHAGLGSLVLRVFYYLGGTLVFAGLGIYIQTVWQDLTSLQRVLITLGPGFVAYLLGIVFARHPDLEKAATPAHLVAFVMQPTGLFVLLDEFFDGDNPALGAMAVFGPLALQQFLTFINLRRPSLLLFTLLFVYGFAGAATAYFDFDFGVSAFACGWFLYVISTDLHRRDAYRELTPLFFTLGSGLMLAGVSYHVGGTIYEPLALSLAFGFLMHAVLSGSRTLFVVSLLYVAGYFLDGFGNRWWGWSAYHRHHYELTAMVTGASLVLAGHWLSRAALISASPLWMFAGTAFALGGAYHLLYETAAAPIFAGIATLAIYAALALRSRAMLAAAILGLLGFVVDYSQRHFARNLSWPLLLILFGFVVLLSGVVFARLSGRIRAQSAPGAATQS
jgi:xanthosine utilization system XapX-like protein